MKFILNLINFCWMLLTHFMKVVLYWRYRTGTSLLIWYDNDFISYQQYKLLSDNKFESHQNVYHHAADSCRHHTGQSRSPGHVYGYHLGWNGVGRDHLYFDLNLVKGCQFIMIIPCNETIKLRNMTGKYNNLPASLASVILITNEMYS